MPTPPKIPQKKTHNGAIIAICTALGLGCIGLSGVAGYAGARMALSNGTSSPSSIISETTSPNGNVAVKVMDVSDIVTKLRPSVVEITTESVSSGNSVFGEYRATGAGSGVILSEDGYIVTNNHVIANASSITVKTLDGNEYPAKLCGTDPQTDIAVIKVDATGLSPAAVGNSNDIHVGQAAIAIGNPLGSLGGTVTTGIISAVGREITVENETMTLLQTDAAINPGNSGGGLFDISGNLIGVVNAKTSDTGIEGLGFAIPISDVTSIIEDLIRDGKVTSRPMLNVSLQDIKDTTYYGQNRELQPGVYVVQLVQGGTADKGGIMVGDRIVTFDGQEVNSAAEVKNILRKHKTGDQVGIVVERDGKTVDLTLDLQGAKASQ